MKISKKLLVIPVIMSLLMIFIVNNYNPILPIITAFTLVKVSDIEEGIKGVWIFATIFFVLLPYNLLCLYILYDLCESFAILPFAMAFLISIEELVLCFIWKMINLKNHRELSR